MSMERIKTLLTHPLAQPLRGCSEAELLQLERNISLPLPPSYRGFLRLAGGGAGKLFWGSDWGPGIVQSFAKDLRENRRLDLYGLEEDLPEDAVIFLSHQGYYIEFFRASLGDSSSVYYFSEGQEMKTFKAMDFTVGPWLEESISASLDELTDSEQRRR
ncbi:SMI1/KNR4 family protein [Corallococcus sp. AS-1-6]|uniref:SMI1/KNR4 family protein n=1 Tax=Corallococcus sp. AS-1-6 TaxID=2874599 RepID=UPI001CBC7E36|nr:SMI1/KNR4 family protein [Corallococcus sp. AS-1-6]